MNSVTLVEASMNLPKVVQATIQNYDETMIVSDNGTVVMVSEAYWEEMQETLRVLNDKRSLKALLSGHQARKEGRPIVSKTIDDLFYDLQN